MKILFIRIGGIGDILLTTPAVKCVKEKHPNAEIFYLAGEKAYSILENNPFINKLIVYKDSHIEAPKLLVPFKLRPWFREVFDGNVFDYIIDLESSWYSAYLSLFIKAKKRLGFRMKKLRYFLYNMIYSTSFKFNETNVYLVEKYIAILKAAGVPGCGDKNLIIKLAPDEIDRAKVFYRENNITDKNVKILLSDSGDWKTKQWPASYWAKLVELLNSGIKNCRIIFLSGPGNEETAEKLKSMNLANLYFSPKLGLRDFSAIVGQGDLMVSCDSGVRHIGVALGLKTIGLFGPVNEKNWSKEDEKTRIITAEGIECRVCHKSKCRNKEHDIRCMTQIKADKVYSIMSHLLQNHP